MNYQANTLLKTDERFFITSWFFPPSWCPISSCFAPWACSAVTVPVCEYCTETFLNGAVLVVAQKLNSIAVVMLELKISSNNLTGDNQLFPLELSLWHCYIPSQFVGQRFTTNLSVSPAGLFDYTSSCSLKASLARLLENGLTYQYVTFYKYLMMLLHYNMDKLAVLCLL